MNLNLAKRQIDAFQKILSVLKDLPLLMLRGKLSKLLLSFILIFQLFFSVMFDTPVKPSGPRIDMNKFELVWSDEFNDHVFDKTHWSGHYCWGDDGTWPRDTAYWNRGQVSFKDGNLIISASYLENGPKGPKGPDGPAYYSYGMDTNPYTDGPGKPGYEQLYGYFEIRCILPKGLGLNPAFWLMSDGMFDTGDGTNISGKGGAEIDVFETKTSKKELLTRYNSVYHTIHIGAYEEYHRSEMQGHFFADKPHEKYNTYGFEWNKDCYIFYINGVETARTDFGGVCQVPLYLILSLGVDENIKENKGLPAEFIIDYVRAYQYKELL